MHRFALIVVVSGCGRIAFDDRGDASSDSVPSGFCATATFSNPPASSLVDDFTTPYTARWAPINPGAPCIAQVGTELIATPSTTTVEYCYAFTLGDFHLTCDSIFMRVPETTSPVVRAQTLIYVTSLADGTNFNVLKEVDGIQMGKEASTDRPFAPFDPVLDVWWRLSERDGVVTFDTSQDGLAWRELLRTPTTVSFDHVEISIGAGTYSTVPPSPGRARFRCYNAPPPCN